MTAEAQPARSVPVYDSRDRRPAFIEEVIGLVRYRDLISQLISRNIRTRYKRSVLGIGWTMLNPLLTMAVMALVFSQVFGATADYYPVYLLAGLIFWNFFAQTTTAIMNELIWGGSLLSRIYVPRTVFAVSAAGTGVVNLVLAHIALVPIMIFVGSPITPALLFIPIPILFIAMFALGIGLFLSTLSLRFGDVIDMYAVLLTAWLYLTPIIYPIEILPESAHWLIRLNPMYHLVESFRQPIVEGHLAPLESIAIAAITSLVVLLGGAWFFARKGDEIAYRV